MQDPNFSLDVIHVAAPCDMPWEEMTGDDRVRFCGQCKLNVFDLSAMTRQEAEQLVLENEGNLCGQFYRRADGTVLTSDCPVGLRAIRRRIARRVAGVAALAGSLLLGPALTSGGRAQDVTAQRSSAKMVKIVGWLRLPLPRPLAERIEQARGLAALRDGIREGRIRGKICVERPPAPPKPAPPR